MDFLLRILFKKIDLIDLETIQQSTWENAITLAENIDEFDTPFIALAIELNAPLWDGRQEINQRLEQKRN